MNVDPNTSKRSQASEALKRIAPQLGEAIIICPSQVSHLLNDLVPHAPGEEFMLDCGFQLSSYEPEIGSLGFKSKSINKKSIKTSELMKLINLKSALVLLDLNYKE